jgi:ribosome biogenesis protein Nip4
MDFELLDPVLWMSIQNQIDENFGEGVTKELVGDLVPISLESKDTKLIYLGSLDWIPIIEQGLGSYELYSFGQFFGKIVKEKFSVAISVLSQIASFTSSRIVVSENAAGPFTYGKSILKQSVLEIGQNLKKGQRVIVLNKTFDCLGLATMTTDGYRVDRMHSNGLVAKNLVDIGLYLRKLF